MDKQQITSCIYMSFQDYAKLHSFFLFFFFLKGRRRRKMAFPIHHVQKRHLPNAHQALLIHYCLPQSAKRQAMQMKGCSNPRLALPVLSLVDHNPASAWKLHSHASMAPCPLNLAQFVSSAQLQLHTGHWEHAAPAQGSL